MWLKVQIVHLHITNIKTAWKYDLTKNLQTQKQGFKKPAYGK